MTSPFRLSIRPGRAPDYTMQVSLYRVQPVYGRDGIVWCPAEGWEIITEGLHFPVVCKANGLMHTQYPDPVTRRRMRDAWNRRG